LYYADQVEVASDLKSVDPRALYAVSTNANPVSSLSWRIYICHLTCDLRL